jgi:hypothetical protein
MRTCPSGPSAIVHSVASRSGGPSWRVILAGVPPAPTHRRSSCPQSARSGASGSRPSSRVYPCTAFRSRSSKAPVGASRTKSFPKAGNRRRAGSRKFRDRDQLQNARARSSPARALRSLLPELSGETTVRRQHLPDEASRRLAELPAGRGARRVPRFSRSLSSGARIKVNRGEDTGLTTRLARPGLGRSCRSAGTHPACDRSTRPASRSRSAGRRAPGRYRRSSGA